MRWRKPQLALLAAGIAVVIVVGLAVGRWLSMARSAMDAPPTLEQLGHYGAVPMFSLTERSGRRVTLDDLRGYVWVADFIYTECTETCPTQSLQLATLQRRFSAAAELRLVSVTVDPEHDKPDVLRRYAERYGATDRWWFLTGDNRDIYCLARDGFHLAVVDSRAAEPPACGAMSWLAPGRAWASHGSQGLLMHSARIIIVDRSAEIRAYHLATDPDSMASLQKNLKAVLSEPAQRRRGGGR